MTELKLLTAIDFAAKKHRNQRRRDADSSPYINHPIAVAEVISAVACVHDSAVLIAAILHDTVEDTATSFHEIELSFGIEVADIVKEVTDDKSLSRIQRKRLQIEHAPTLSTGATLVKIADKSMNVFDIAYSPPSDWGHARKIDYLDWTEKIVSRCPAVNKELLKHYYRILEDARRVIQST